MGLIQRIFFVADEASKAQLKHEGEEAGHNVASGIERATNRITGFFKKIAEFVGIAYGIRTIERFAAASINAAIESEKAMAGLDFTLAKIGKTAEETGGDVKALSKYFEDMTPFGDEAGIRAFDKIVSISGKYAESLEAVKVAADLAVSRHIDLESASMMVGRAMIGNVSLLERQGIYFRDNAKAIEELRAQFGGAAEDQMQTFGGQVAKLKTHWDNFKEALGRALMAVGSGPSIMETLTNAFERLADWVDRNGVQIANFGQDIWWLATKLFMELKRAVMDVADIFVNVFHGAVWIARNALIAIMIPIANVVRGLGVLMSVPAALGFEWAKTAKANIAGAVAEIDQLIARQKTAAANDKAEAVAAAQRLRDRSYQWRTGAIKPPPRPPRITTMPKRTTKTKPGRTGGGGGGGGGGTKRKKEEEDRTAEERAAREAKLRRQQEIADLVELGAAESKDADVRERALAILKEDNEELARGNLTLARRAELRREINALEQPTGRAAEEAKRKAAADKAELEEIKRAQQEVADYLLKLDSMLVTTTETLADDALQALEKFEQEVSEKLEDSDFTEEQRDRIRERAADVRDMLQKELAAAKLIDKQAKDMSALPTDSLDTLMVKWGTINQEIAAINALLEAQNRKLGDSVILSERMKELEKQRQQVIATMQGRFMTNEEIEAQLNQTINVVEQREKEAQDERRKAAMQFTKNADLMARAIQDGVDGALQLADALGMGNTQLVSMIENIGSAVEGIIKLSGAIKTYRALEKIGEGGFLNLLPVIGEGLAVAGGVVSLLSGIFGESKEHKEMVENLKKNADATKKLEQRIASLNISGTDWSRALQAVNSLLSFRNPAEAMFGDAAGRYTEQYERLLEDTGMSMSELAGVAQSLGITLDGSRASMESLKHALETVGLTKFGQDFESQMKRFNTRVQLFNVTNPVIQLEMLLDAATRNFGPNAIRTAMQKIDFRTVTGRAQAETAIQALYNKMNTLGIKTAELGGMNQEQFLGFLEQFHDLLKEAGTVSVFKFGETFADQLAVMNQEIDLFDITDPIEQLTKLRDVLVSPNFGAPALAKALGGLRLDTPEGRAAAEAAVRSLFNQIKTSGITVEQLGKMTMDELTNALTQFDAALEAATAADPNRAQAVGIQQTITQVAALRLDAGIGTINYWLSTWLPRIGASTEALANMGAIGNGPRYVFEDGAVRIVTNAAGTPDELVLAVRQGMGEALQSAQLANGNVTME